ncbi:hypothetical protein ACFWY9_19635 [Amycolatopsis sp. NPDC059027]|uniref:hypothetical protein n=1 Tax=Amycolatopsis sp. NPDC059027 TaxID=3346709 RepID=UPI00366E294F
MTAAEVGRLAGVSPNTVRGWARRNPPLVATRLPNGQDGFLWSQLLEFCEVNAHLPAARKILDREHARTRSAAAADGLSKSTVDLETLRAIARDLRAAAHSNLQAALTAARHAEASAKAHREQLEHLATTLAAYDSALSTITAPATLHD